MQISKESSIVCVIQNYISSFSEHSSPSFHPVFMGESESGNEKRLNLNFCQIFRRMWKHFML